jgi:SAM-dependent methyltransferase
MRAGVAVAAPNCAIARYPVDTEMTATAAAIPDWACSLLACPGGQGRPTVQEEKIVDGGGRMLGRVDAGVLRFAVNEDASVQYYRSIGGAHFHERGSATFAMSALDTPVYHGYLRRLETLDRDGVIVDVGSGDGRNALPWLERGYKKVVLVDPVAAALRRFRDRIEAQNAAWLNNILLIEADARALPLLDGCAHRVLAIESLYYLNEDYEQGLGECRRIMRSDGLLLLSDRDYEGGLLTRLLYGGVERFVAQGSSRDVWDGMGNERVRTRCFTQAEMISLVKRQGLHVRETLGISAFALVLGFLAGLDRLGTEAQTRRAEVSELLSGLGTHGMMRRCNVLIVGRKPRSARTRKTTPRVAPKRRG